MKLNISLTAIGLLSAIQGCTPHPWVRDNFYEFNIEATYNHCSDNGHCTRSISCSDVFSGGYHDFLLKEGTISKHKMRRIIDNISNTLIRYQKMQIPADYVSMFNESKNIKPKRNYRFNFDSEGIETHSHLYSFIKNGNKYYIIRMTPDEDENIYVVINYEDARFIERLLEVENIVSNVCSRH